MILLFFFHTLSSRIKTTKSSFAKPTVSLRMPPAGHSTVLHRESLEQKYLQQHEFIRSTKKMNPTGPSPAVRLMVRDVRRWGARQGKYGG